MSHFMNDEQEKQKIRQVITEWNSDDQSLLRILSGEPAGINFVGAI